MPRSVPISPGEASPRVRASTMARRAGSPRAACTRARASNEGMSALIESMIADGLGGGQVGPRRGLARGVTGGEQGGELAHQAGPGAVVDPAGAAFGIDQAGVAQGLEMVRDRR